MQGLHRACWRDILGVRPRRQVAENPDLHLRHLCTGRKNLICPINDGTPSRAWSLFTQRPLPKPGQFPLDTSIEGPQGPAVQGESQTVPRNT